MKTALFVCAVLLVAYASAKPGKGATKASLQVKGCIKDCGDDYKPVCGGDGTGKPISFGSECVLNNYNCEQDKHFRVESKGECPGGGGVRLS